MKIQRSWSMPNKNTFSIKPINELVHRYIEHAEMIIDPFCGNSPFKHHCCLSNDLNVDISASYNMDALAFLKIVKHEIDIVLFDPPYSPRQVSECYKKMDMAVNMQTTQSSFWGNLKKEIARIIKPGGHVITCGWNSGGIGKTLGFEIVEILLVAHGGWHNDTIVTVEKKLKDK